jgi:rhodanese-related sulfurtransferase
VTLNELFDDARGRIRRYTPREAHAAMQEGGAVIVDIRDRYARERDGVIPGAHHVPRTVLEWRVASDDHRNPALADKRLILVCDHGYSTVFAAAALLDLGADAGDIIGGFEAWKADGLETTVPRPWDGVPGTGPPD